MMRTEVTRNSSLIHETGIDKLSRLFLLGQLKREALFVDEVGGPCHCLLLGFVEARILMSLG